MKEIHEFRIYKDYYHLLPFNNAKFNGAVYVLNLSGNDPLFQVVGELYQKLRKENKILFSFWQVKRQYDQKELNEATLFHVKIKTAFEPTGEECGTIYDETAACEICGANRKQVGPLRLRKGSIPKKDIARTIAGEVVVSEKFAELVKNSGLQGISLEPVLFGNSTANYYQLIPSSPELELAENTIAGQHPFDFSSNDHEEQQEFNVSDEHTLKSEKTIVKCPKGDLIGTRLISQLYILNNPSILKFDFFVTKQKIGAKMGLLRPEPIYLCSQNFRNMVLEEKLTGFEFEIANIETGE